jgi:putative addiction module killer protein
MSARTILAESTTSEAARQSVRRAGGAGGLCGHDLVFYVLERRIGFGPGCRVYFAKDGLDVVILLGCGTKKRQRRDIEDAYRRWREYRLRRKGDG